MSQRSSEAAVTNASSPLSSMPPATSVTSTVDNPHHGMFPVELFSPETRFCPIFAKRGVLVDKHCGCICTSAVFVADQKCTPALQ